MKRDGFEAAAWRRRLWLGLYEAQAALHSPVTRDEDNDWVIEHGCDAQRQIVEDVRIMQLGGQPSGEFLDSLEAMRSHQVTA